MRLHILEISHGYFGHMPVSNCCGLLRVPSGPQAQPPHLNPEQAEQQLKLPLFKSLSISRQLFDPTTSVMHA
jgi:hypothetical protein